MTRDYLLHHKVCPTSIDANGVLEIAASSGAYLDAVEEIGMLYGRRTTLRDEPVDALERMIERLASADAIETEGDGIDSASIGTADVRAIANEPPVVRYVNLLLQDAFSAGASDIHLESTRTAMTARLRIDGMLVPTVEPPRALQAAIVSRLKLLAELDIAERRRPQDGRIRIRLEAAELDLRVSTLPTVHGESVVLRLLDRGNRPVELEALGMPAVIFEQMTSLTRRPHGMLLVTGPTGSGKTTTLYGALRRRDARAEKIVTVEDPVEYQLDQVTQVPVHRQAGVTFATALRAILRQDPDVVMVGEMRDPETAEVATQAAMTGHLVYSTLHTNDAPGAIPRLLDLGVAPYLVAGTVVAVLAQRLVRVVCPNCTRPMVPSDSEIASLISLGHSLSEMNSGASAFAAGTGCSECRGTGYRGRVGVFELLMVDDALRAAIADRAPAIALRDIAARAGYRPMLDDGLSKAAAGLTTISEVLRVAHA